MNRSCLSSFLQCPHSFDGAFRLEGGIPASAIRRGDWKLIERLENGRSELFNLSTDIGEQNDVAGQHQELVADMRDSLHQWYESVDAKLLRRKGNGPEPWRP